MEHVTPLAITFRRPARFDLAAYWKASTAKLDMQRKSYRAVVSIDPQAAVSLKQWCPAFPVESDRRRGAAEGWLTLRVEFESEEQARFVIRGMGPKVQALEPAALRERILADARAVVGSFGYKRASR
jgi:predicted DNA-binding transcriptional regulator YafY